MRVIVTRPEIEAAEWVRGLRLRGLDAVALPLIAIGAPADVAPMRQAWSRIGEYRAAMFVSANAVRAFFGIRPCGAPFTTRAWATGAGTHAALEAAGAAQIDSPPADAQQFDSEALWEVVASQCARGDRVLIVRGGDAGAGISGRDWLADQLSAQGVQVDQVPAYERACPAFTPAQQSLAAAAASDGSVWLFSSSQAIVNLRACLPDQPWLSARSVVTHPRIGETARGAGFGVVCVSRPPIDAVIAALESLG